MKRTIPFFFLAVSILFAFSACVPNHSKTNSNTTSRSLETQITGQLLNSDNEFALLISDDFTDTVPIETGQKFHFRWNTNIETYYTLRTGTSSLRLYITPGDNLHVSYSVNSILPTLTFSGKGSDANEYLKEKYQFLARQNLSAVHLYDLPVKEFRYLADSLYVVGKLFFEDYQQKHPSLTPNFITQEQSSLIYDWATKLMEYPRMGTMAQTLDETDYFKFLKKVTVNDSTLLNLYEYRMFLNSYIAWYADAEMKKRGNQNLETHEVSLIRMQMVNAHIQNTVVKDYVLASVLKEQVKYFGYKNCELLFKTFDASCTNPQIKETLLAPYLKYNSLQQSEIAPNTSFEDIKGNHFTFESFRGSYIYIDVWATWCLPCKRESPFFAGLQKKYGHKNIVFLSLSVDTEKADWKNYLNHQKLEQNQYWVTDAEAFLLDYQIKTIPRFIIINPQGKVTNSDAFRPSEPEIAWFEALPEKPLM